MDNEGSIMRSKERTTLIMEVEVCRPNDTIIMRME